MFCILEEIIEEGLVDDFDKAYIEKLDKIIEEKPNLSPFEIKSILLAVFYYIKIKDDNSIYNFNSSKKIIKYDFNVLTKEEIITKYFDGIFKLYEDKISVEEMISLCMQLEDEKICEKIIKKYYRGMRKEIRKIIYLSPSQNSELLDTLEMNFEIQSPFKDNNYKIEINDIHPKILKVFYKYFGNDIKYEKENTYKVLSGLNEDILFYFLQEEIKKNNNEALEKILRILKNREYENVKLTSELSKCKWIKLSRNKEFLEKMLKKDNDNKSSIFFSEKKKSFQDAFLDFIEEINIKNLSIEKININKIDSIYCLEYLVAIDALYKESYRDNKNSYLFLICFKLFLKEFLKEYDDELTNKDIEYLERIFRRAVQRKKIYKVLEIKNKENLIHNYKSNDMLQKPTMVDIKYINNYSVKQYRNVKELINKITNNNSNLIKKITKVRFDEYIIISLNLLGYDVTEKIIKYDIVIWKEIVDNIKEKSAIFLKAFKEFVLKGNDQTKILEYHTESYLEIFEKLIVSGKNPTLNSMNKALKSIKNLLVPDNEHIEETLEKLNDVAKGEPFLEKINGIKLYEEYRKRIKSSIPDCSGKYNDLEYKLVDLHDKEIISNGIGKYLLPDNKKASSCLTPNGKAKTCLEHGAINPNGRFFKITKNGKIVAYSWVWRCGDVLCFDNIELTEEIEKIKDYEKEIYEIYLQAAKCLTEITKNETNNGIKLVLIGRNPIDIKNKYIDSLQSLKNLSNNMFQPNSKYVLYLKDSGENQVILYGEYNENLDTSDVEPIYLYERPKVEEFKNLDKDTLEKRINAIYYNHCLQHSIKYHKIENTYESGYIGEDWFVGNKKDGNLDFFYNDNDKRLFSEAKKFIKFDHEIQMKTQNVYIPKYKIENILNLKNIDINVDKIQKYLKYLDTHDYEIPNNYYSHTTHSLKTLDSIFRDGAITSTYYGKRFAEGKGGTNGIHYICIAKIGSWIYNFYKKTGTIILDDNMQIFNENSFILPITMSHEFFDFANTSYPIRCTGTDGEYQVKDIITKDHFDSLLATRNDTLHLAQIILLNEVYDLNLPIVLEPTMSKIDTNYVKKYIKLNK